jgi:hypothetical protein
MTATVAVCHRVYHKVTVTQRMGVATPPLSGCGTCKAARTGHIEKLPDGSPFRIMGKTLERTFALVL